MKKLFKVDMNVADGIADSIGRKPEMNRLSIVLLTLALVVSASFAENRHGNSQVQSSGQQMKRSDESGRNVGPSTESLDSVEDNFNFLLTNSYETAGRLHFNSFVGDYLYGTITSTPGFFIFDISDPDTIAPIGSAHDIPLGPNEYLDQLDSGNGRVYVLTSEDRLLIFDVSNPADVSLTSSTTIGGNITYMVANGNIVYFSTWGLFPDYVSQLIVYDATNAASPVLADQLAMYDRGGMLLQGNYLYYLQSNDDLWIYDISDPYNVTEAGSYTGWDSFSGLRLAGDRLYWPGAAIEGDDPRIGVFDLTSPTSPVYLTSILGGYTSTPDVTAYGDHIVVTNSVEDTTYMRVVDVSDLANDNYSQTGYYERAVDGYSRTYFNGDRAYDYGYEGAGFVLEVLNFAAALGDSLSFTVANIDTSSFPLVSFELTVTDSSGSAVTGVNTSDVQLSEDGVVLSNVAVSQLGDGVYQVFFQPDNDTYDGAVRQIDLFVETTHPFGGTSLSYTAPPPEVYLALDNTDVSSFPDLHVTVTVTDETEGGVTGLTSGSFVVKEDEIDQATVLVDDLGDGSYDVSYYTSNAAFDETVRQVQLVVNHNTVADTIDTQYTAPGPELHVAINHVDGSTFPTVTNYLKVNDELGQHVPGLIAANVDLEEDGVAHSLESVNETNTAGRAATSLMLNFRSSMTPEAIEQMRVGARTYIRNFAPGDTGLVGTYAGALGNVSNLTSDTTALMSIVNSTHNGLTVGSYLIDDIQFAGAAVNFTSADKAVIIVADSADDGRSVTSLSDLYANLRAANVRVFPIGIGSMVDASFMQALADTSGGRYYQVSHPDSLPGIFKQISTIMQSNYEVAYQTQNDVSDGSERAVQLTVTQDDLSDSADSGYTAPNPPTLAIGEVSVVPGDSVKVPVTVSSFTNVSVIEFYIHYDPTALSFGRVSSAAMDAPVHNAPDETEMFILTWSSISPITLNDGDTLMHLHFATDNLGFEEVTPVIWAEADSSYLANYNGRVFAGTALEDGSVTGLSIMTVSGAVSYYSNDIALDGVTVDLAGDTTLTTTTDSDGNYSFLEIRPGSYTVTPSLNDESGHPGVSTLDAYRIQQHVASIDPFTTGYDLFASEVNGADGVNTVDAYQIQRVIVGLDEAFAAGDWAFVSSHYPMNSDNWADADQLNSFTLTDTDSLDQDFYGHRVGDANGTWPSYFPGPSKNEDFRGIVSLADAAVQPDGVVTVELTASEMPPIGSVEAHIAFDPNVIELVEMNFDALEGAVAFATDSTISVSWFNINEPLHATDLVLGSFQFEAVGPLNSESALDLYRVEFGTELGEKLFTEVSDGSVSITNDLGVDYQGAELVTDWALRPAYPNPFNAYTTLSFDMKETSRVQIRVYNILGDLVATLVEGSLPKGRYASSVNAQAWSSGTYFVVMKTSGFNKVQKIVLLK
ncbi:T9SS type A sorting domain-containing protein [bacterium]|nr:T9SS type A sorting domain-containing protein [bacterium]